MNDGSAAAPCWAPQYFRPRGAERFQPLIGRANDGRANDGLDNDGLANDGLAKLA